MTKTGSIKQKLEEVTKILEDTRKDYEFRIDSLVRIEDDIQREEQEEEIRLLSNKLDDLYCEQDKLEEELYYSPIIELKHLIIDLSKVMYIKRIKEDDDRIEYNDDDSIILYLNNGSIITLGYNDEIIDKYKRVVYNKNNNYNYMNNIRNELSEIKEALFELGTISIDTSALDNSVEMMGEKLNGVIDATDKLKNAIEEMSERE